MNVSKFDRQDSIVHNKTYWDTCCSSTTVNCHSTRHRQIFPPKITLFFTFTPQLQLRACTISPTRRNSSSQILFTEKGPNHFPELRDKLCAICKDLWKIVGKLGQRSHFTMAFVKICAKSLMKKAWLKIPLRNSLWMAFVKIVKKIVGKVVGKNWWKIWSKKAATNLTTYPCRKPTCPMITRCSPKPPTSRRPPKLAHLQHQMVSSSPPHSLLPTHGTAPMSAEMRSSPSLRHRWDYESKPFLLSYYFLSFSQAQTWLKCHTG